LRRTCWRAFFKPTLQIGCGFAISPSLATREGWLYLAVVLDLFARRVVGWSMQSSLERGLVLAALEQALQRRQPAPGLLHHSDRGSQYASADNRS
jgi:putative transposase